MEEAFQSYSGNESILPTFTFVLKNNSIIRGMKDSGCQANFVTEDFALKNKLKVLKNDYTLTVNGFNSSKEYITKLVALEFKNGNQIKAICVPKINTNLKLPGLSIVVKDFLNKGYEICR